MKQKDIALIAVVVFISVVLSLVVSKFVLVSATNRQQKVQVVEPISSNFPTLDSRYFNAQAVDPTKIITIGSNNNPDPFTK